MGSLINWNHESLTNVRLYSDVAGGLVHDDSNIRVFKQCWVPMQLEEFTNTHISCLWYLNKEHPMWLDIWQDYTIFRSNTASILIRIC